MLISWVHIGAGSGDGDNAVSNAVVRHELEMALHFPYRCRRPSRSWYKSTIPVWHYMDVAVNLRSIAKVW
jgi:hypothetical protein